MTASNNPIKGKGWHCGSFVQFYIWNFEVTVHKSDRVWQIYNSDPTHNHFMIAGLVAVVKAIKMYKSMWVKTAFLLKEKTSGNTKWIGWTLLSSWPWVSTSLLMFHRHNGSLANGDKGRRRSRLALYKRPKANGVKPDVIHNVSTPLVSKVKNILSN